MPLEISEEQGDGLGHGVKGCHCLGEVPQQQPRGGGGGVERRREEGSIPEFGSQMASIHGVSEARVHRYRQYVQIAIHVQERAWAWNYKNHACLPVLSFSFHTTLGRPQSQRFSTSFISLDTY